MKNSKRSFYSSIRISHMSFHLSGSADANGKQNRRLECEQRKGCFGYVDIKGWEGCHTKKHSHGSLNLNAMQNEGRSSTGSVFQGEYDIAMPFEADDMDISPINFPSDGVVN
ncbi:hypothetical protein SADUNF_Sadunf14G0125000 [Salix dunnii]|uniref:Uncharacterized protein n=1 Tax=Salix dunnii TaxID=1413687 RepID=A0A835MK80_9ROSI|nr:hypothetical protein SADUNF_Sadunf14G0125000 [Salix dunnii]